MADSLRSIGLGIRLERRAVWRLIGFWYIGQVARDSPPTKVSFSGVTSSNCDYCAGTDAGPSLATVAGRVKESTSEA